VIAADVGGNAELVRHGKTGLLVPDCDVESFAGSLLRLALRPEEAAALGRTARVLAESDFSVKTMVDRYQRLYDRLLAERPAAPPRA
jgi:glycosyltransferase involved in cell wall biosynthesis